MKNTKTIEISLALNAFIEQNRKNFSETPDDILSRILGISPNPTPVLILEEAQGWTTKGITFKDGTLFRMIYNGQKFYGKVSNRNFTMNNKRYKSFSEAASELARTKDARKTNLNGWNLFEYRNNEQEDWKPVKDLRK